jgi:3-keto-5-aminohexanoate cleavage enzyme
MVRNLPEGALFSTSGVGKYQWAMTTMSIILGGNVRIGLEDNLYLKRGQKLSGNAEAVQKIVRIATELNRPIATPAQAREMLGISVTPSSY